jgi:hypothetical protein
MKRQVNIATGIIGLWLSILPIMLFWVFANGGSAYEPNKLIAWVEFGAGVLMALWFLYFAIISWREK